ncbi:MAG: hypothetical protein HOV94_19860 [Saccharothrix sp.]|nr:hypothetical protein [Saccharothrix sp.]
MSDSMTTFSALVAGGVGVNEHGGQALIRAIDTMHEGIKWALGRSEVIGQEPPLGTTPAAQVYKPYLATVATDPAQGFLSAAEQFEKDLEQFRADVTQAMATYQTNDEEQAQRVKNAGGPILSD